MGYNPKKKKTAQTIRLEQEHSKFVIKMDIKGFNKYPLAVKYKHLVYFWLAYFYGTANGTCKQCQY